MAKQEFREDMILDEIRRYINRNVQNREKIEAICPDLFHSQSKRKMILKLAFQVLAIIPQQDL
ncbi:hypothetical protein SAMN05421852_1071 [Thermoflavimicrobium dichotomicum]|uniref:Uncharacterized protein n=1 Tax=Thermoflavimicrobium dichotomicum TaxID=46223 RepID=A0A1I3Q558_9BACL|nr:hypothetical protein SAMN05421852_1071 [Thermoflavimicrobium dichotomicum]